MLFYKYQGLGNDYLIYDCRKYHSPLTPDLIKKVCNRNYGLGSDGILIGPIIYKNLIGVKIYNPDGSEAEKSGNGVRIFAKYLKDVGYIKSSKFKLHTLGGNVLIKYNNKEATNITVSMGKLDFSKEAIGAIDVPDEVVDTNLTFNSKTYKCTCVSIGNPHCVIPVENVSKKLVCEIGKYSENAPYFPNKINTQIVSVIDRHNVNIEIFERGAGYTLASGSSSTAVAGAMKKLGKVDSPVYVHMPGGILKLEIDDDYNAVMTGDVNYIGKLEIFENFN